MYRMLSLSGNNPFKELFPDNDGDVLYIIPLITRLLAKNEKITSVSLFIISSLPAFVVLISREIVRQRRSRHLATEYAGVNKLHGG